MPLHCQDDWTATFLTGIPMSPAHPFRSSLVIACSHPRLPSSLSLCFLLLGILCRLVLYLARFPLWCDEVFLSFNFLTRDLAGLAGRLEYDQVAPLLFLWGQRGVVALFGSSEFALRLVPLVASIAGLVLFWYLARLLLTPQAAALAVACLAFARIPLEMSHTAKPYSVDLLASIALLLAACRLLDEPSRPSRVVLLFVLAPLAVLLSYPALFVAGAVGLALLPLAWHGSRTSRMLLLGGGLLCLSVFAAHYLLVGRSQVDPASDVARFYQHYWSGAFLPLDPLALLRWLLVTHTGRLFGYPASLGGLRGGLTFLLVLVGIAWFARRRRAVFQTLLLGPFALNLLASGLRLYPYSGDLPRVMLHLAPMICLLAGAGLAALLEACPGIESRRGVVFALASLGVVCAGGVEFAKTLGRGSHTDYSRWSREMARQIETRTQPGDAIVVLGPEEGVEPTLRWYLHHLPRTIGYEGEKTAPARGGRLWCIGVRFDPGATRWLYMDSCGPIPRALPDSEQDLERRLASRLQREGEWTAQECVSQKPRDGFGARPFWYEVVLWQRRARSGALSVSSETPRGPGD